MREPLARMSQQGYAIEKDDLCLRAINTGVDAMIQYIDADLRDLGFIS